MQAGALRAAISSLGQITAAMDTSSWPSAAGPFNRLLGLSLDARPKVRRAAQSALVGTLRAIQGTPAMSPASEAILRGEHLSKT